MKILFMCVANSARSQLAEGIARKIFGSRAEVFSAGSEPSGKVQPLALQVLQNQGADISLHSSKSIDALPKNIFANLDYIFTLCAEEVCPHVASRAHRLHWPLPDPAPKSKIPQLKDFESVSVELSRLLEEFGKTHKLL